MGSVGPTGASQQGWGVTQVRSELATVDHACHLSGPCANYVRPDSLAKIAIGAATAAGLVALAMAQGSYDVVNRQTAALVIWCRTGRARGYPPRRPAWTGMARALFSAGILSGRDATQASLRPSATSCRDPAGCSARRGGRWVAGG